MPTSEQCRNCRKLGTRECSYYTDEYGRECSNFDQRKPTMKLTMTETRIVAFALLAAGIAFVILSAISYVSNGNGRTPTMADEPTEIVTDTIGHAISSEN